MAGWNTLVQAETLAIALGRPDVGSSIAASRSTSPGAGESAYLHSAICRARCTRTWIATCPT